MLNNNSRKYDCSHLKFKNSIWGDAKMSITINFNDIDLNDWIDIDNDDVPTLKELINLIVYL